MNTTTAQIELDILEKEIDSSPHQGSVMEYFIEKGLNAQIAAEIDRLWSVTRRIGSRVYRVGKIIVHSIIKFIQRNPKTIIAIAIAAAVSWLLGSIPILGTILGPLSAVLGLFVGIPLGQAMDMVKRGELENANSFGSVFVGAISFAHEFFQFLADIFNTLKHDWEE